MIRRLGLAAAVSLALIGGSVSAAPALTAEQAADRLIAAQHVRDQMESMLPVIIEQTIRTLLRGQNKAREVEARKIITEEYTASFGRTIPLLVARQRDLYVSIYSFKELQGLVGFFESPLGQKFVTVYPQIQAQMAQFGAAAGQAAGADAQPRIVDRLRKANFNLAPGV